MSLRSSRPLFSVMKLMVSRTSLAGRSCKDLATEPCPSDVKRSSFTPSALISCREGGREGVREGEREGGEEGGR